MHIMIRQWPFTSIVPQAVTAALMSTDRRLMQVEWQRLSTEYQSKRMSTVHISVHQNNIKLFLKKATKINEDLYWHLRQQKLHWLRIQTRVLLYTEYTVRCASVFVLNVYKQHETILTETGEDVGERPIHVWTKSANALPEPL